MAKAIIILFLLIGITSNLSFAADDDDGAGAGPGAGDDPEAGADTTCANLNAFDRYKHTTDCHKYNECTTGSEPTATDCPNGLGYDDATKSCVWANQISGCGDAPAAAADDCGGIPTDATVACAAGTVYNRMLDACVKKGSYVCTSNELLPDCNNPDYTDTMYISDKSNCAGYFRCIKGIRYAGECPAGYYFNPNNQMCSFMSKDVKCSAFLSTSTGSNDDGFDYDNVCKGKAGQFVADPRHCQAYIYCSSETQKRQAFCAAGKYFNDGKCTSTAPSSCTCEKFGEMDASAVELIPHPDKTKFYTCKKGQRIEGQCATGTFSSTLKSCKI